MRRVVVRSLAVLLLGLAALAGVLYYASTVDGRPPTVEAIRLTQHLPSDESVALTTTSVEVAFSEQVQHETAERAFQVDPDIGGAFSWSGATLTFTPTDRLPLDAAFVVRIAAGVRDRAGNRMDNASAPLAFTTVGHPVVVATQPSDGEEDVALDSPIVLRFSTLMDTASVESAISISPAITWEASWSGEEVTLTPRQALLENRTYVVSLRADALDAEGIPLGEDYQFSFTTAVSSLRPQVLFPADGTVGISPYSPIAIVFDRELVQGASLGDAFAVSPEVAGSVEARPLPGAAGVEEPGLRSLVFRPSDQLQPNTTYTVTLAGGIAAADGSRLSSAVSWRFTTGAPPSVLSNQVVFLSDRAGIANLWTMNPDGSGERQLSSELSAVTSYAVAPNGRSVVVGDGTVLVRLRPDGGGRQVLTPDDVYEFDPSFAPDGSSLVSARADKATGGGLGIWLRGPEATDATQLELPAATPAPTLRATPSALPAASGTNDVGPLLRAPRFSPDGSAIAFVNQTAGRIGIYEIDDERLSSVAWGATAAPAWLADASGVLVGGLPDPLPVDVVPGPLAAFDPSALGLSPSQLGGQRIVRVDRETPRVELLPPASGSSRPVSGIGGRYLYLHGGDAASAGGELWYVAREGGDPRRLFADDGPPVVSAAFGVEPGTVLAARRGDPSQAGSGIWLLDFAGSGPTQLTQDGWLPRWLP